MLLLNFAATGMTAPGTYALGLPAPALATIRGLLERPNESAGQLLMQFDARALKPVGIRMGTKHNVPLPQAPVSFHTHPWTCTSEDACYVDAPSPEDVAAVLKCSQRQPKMLAHLVFTAAGSCYAMVPGSRPQQAAVQACERLFDSIDSDRPVLSASKQLAFTRAWVKCMQQHGINAAYFPKAEHAVLHVHVT